MQPNTAIVLIFAWVCPLSAQTIPLNGMWQWKTAPEGAWGQRRVPEAWPAGSGNTAWYQREIAVPPDWAGKRIALHVEYLNSYAAVSIDGRPVGEMRFPAGEVDITNAVRSGGKHMLGMQVAALPLKAVIESYHDTAFAKTIESTVERKGLCGDVYLAATPIGARIAGVRVETSVRQWRIGLDVALEALDVTARYALRVRISDAGRVVRELTSEPFPGSPRFRFSQPWHPEKLWDTITPQNRYHASVELLDERGHTLDTAQPVEFGFRELWIEGRDFYLNGTRIHLSAMPIDNAQEGAQKATYQAARATLRWFKSFGINFVYTHNYGCEPGAHLSFEQILRAADDEGVLVALSQPHFAQYDWTTADADSTNGYARHAQFYVRVAGSHPSVVFYAMSHNATGYSEDMNPDMIDGIHSERDQWSLRNAARAQRAEAIVHQQDSSRIVYHHASGNLGPMHVVNFYGNWIPIEEMSDWFEHWATTGVKPLFTCEYSVPFLWDWGMYRGWYQGKREFGGAAVPWEFHAAEWDAQFLGARAYQITEEEKANLRWEAAKIRQGQVWHHWEYPFPFHSQAMEDRFRVVAQYVTDNWRAFRTWGVSATSPPWDFASYWKGEDQPTVAAEALRRNNAPLLAYIAGGPAGFTSKDHNFLPGETVEKQIVVINDSRRRVTAQFTWSFGDQRATGETACPTGAQRRIPLQFRLPDDIPPGRYELRASVRFDSGETQADSFGIDVLARPAALPAGGKIALFDPRGETAALLDSLGVRYDRVDAAASLAGFDTLIIGKHALTVTGGVPAVSHNLKVLVFEQTADVLQKRLGFRTAEYGLRQVFARVPDHALLAGITEDELRDWRGASTTLPPRLGYEKPGLFSGAPVVEWAGIRVTRVWRAGNRGNVASALIEKPARGDFLPIVDGGYALQYSPLLEYREARGMVLFCQMDVTGRTDSDPAATRLVRNILSYVRAWRPSAARPVVYAGGREGREYLRAVGVAFTEFQDGALAPDQLLVMAPGASAPGVRVEAGVRTVALGLDEREASEMLAARIGMVQREHIAAYFAPFGAGSVFAGISPAEVQNRDPRIVPLVNSGATVFGDGVLAQAGDVAFSQMAPWQFRYAAGQMHVKRTFRRVAVMTMRLLAGAGAAAQTPLLRRFSTPAKDEEKRWLDGFYLDTPEEWDDPYRFFRW